MAKNEIKQKGKKQIENIEMLRKKTHLKKDAVKKETQNERKTRQEKRK